MKRPSVAIVLLNYNNYPDTAECLKSLSEAKYENFTIIVVDNDSPDGSGETISREFSEIIYLQSGENGGFSKGNNVGIKYALNKRFDYIMLLNNDTTVDEDFLEPLVYAGEKFDDVGIVTGKGMYYNQPNKIHMCGGKLQKYKITYKRYHADKLETEVQDKDKYVNFASCYFMLVKSQVFIEAGLLNEKYFGGTEETEFNYVVQKLGWKVYYCSGSKIWHKIGGSFKSGGYEATYLALRNKMLFCRENYSKFEKSIWIPLYFLYAFIVHLPKRYVLNLSSPNKNTFLGLLLVISKALADGLVRTDITINDYTKYRGK